MKAKTSRTRMTTKAKPRRLIEDTRKNFEEAFRLLKEKEVNLAV